VQHQKAVAVNTSAAGPFHTRPTKAFQPRLRFAAERQSSHAGRGLQGAQDGPGAGAGKAPAGWRSGSWQAPNETTSFSSAQAESLKCSGNAGNRPGSNKKRAMEKSSRALKRVWSNEKGERLVQHRPSYGFAEFIIQGHADTPIQASPQSTAQKMDLEGGSLPLGVLVRTTPFL